MGRARGTKRTASPAPGRGNYPPELRDLQRRGGMAPDWHDTWHGRGGGVGDAKVPEHSVNIEGVSNVLYFLVYDSLDQNGDRLDPGNINTKTSICTVAGRALADTEIGQQIAEIFRDWKQNNREVYEKVRETTSEEDIFHTWGAVASSDYDRHYRSLDIRPLALRTLQTDDQTNRQFEMSIPFLQLRLLEEAKEDLGSCAWELTQSEV